METVTISPKFQVVIPKSVRQQMQLNVGEKLRVVPHGDTIALIPVRPMSYYRGFLKGIDTDIEREREEDRL